MGPGAKASEKYFKDMLFRTLEKMGNANFFYFNSFQAGFYM